MTASAMVATVERVAVTLYSRNGKVLSRNYIEVAKALRGIKHDAVIDGELVAIAPMASPTSNYSRMRAAATRDCNIAHSI